MDRNLRCEIAQVFASESVRYHYEVMNEVWLTAAKLKGYKVKHIAPGTHWLYKEKLLSDIYDETYPFEE